LVNHLNPQKNEDVVKNEINYTLSKLKITPMNESGYSYIRGFMVDGFTLKQFQQICTTMEEIIEDFKECHFAYSLLLDTEIDKNVNEPKILDLFETLIKLDYIRRKYWAWRKSNYKECSSNKNNN
jgi:hypothetical protein